MNDPQPNSGLYAHCEVPADCLPGYACYSIQDQNMVYLDGFCTILCDSIADCVPEPKSQAVTECFQVNPDQKACSLKCNLDSDCPLGMTCESITEGDYCW